MNQPTEPTSREGPPEPIRDADLSTDRSPLENPPRQGWYTWGWALFLVAAMSVGYYLMAWQRSYDPSYHAWVGRKLDLHHLRSWRDANRALPAPPDTLRVTLVNFWGPWCPPCRVEWPHLVDLAAAYADDPAFRLVSVACAGGGRSERSLGFQEELSEFLDRHKPPFELYVDPDASLRQTMARWSQGRFHYPTTVLLDQRGTIRAVWEGYQPGYEREMKTQIDRLLASGNATRDAKSSKPRKE